jgi:GTP-binding protein
MSKQHLPVVALVGRTNVGKSTLFNRISRRTESLVADQEGVTRDYISEAVSWKNTAFELIDTGGLVPSGTDDPFYGAIEAVSSAAAQRASVIIFVCDGKNGITLDDQRLARHYHTLGKTVLLAINKADNKKEYEANTEDFYSLGFSEFFPISAEHGTGISNLLDEVVATLPSEVALPDAPACKISLIGKPNVGKSSLMNALVNYERSIVSDAAGTTREAISERISFYGEDLLLTDTAGMRRKRKVTDSLETLMVKSSLSAVRTADIVVVMIDASAGRLSDQELKLLHYAFEEHKAVLLLFNKSDLVTPELKNLLEFELEQYNYLLKHMPKINTSCITGKNVGYVFREIEKIRKRMTQPMNDAQLTIDLHEYFRKKPLFNKRQKLQVFSIQRRKEKGVSFTLCVNQPQWFGQSQLSCIENFIRKKYDLIGCPIHFVLIKR